MKTLFITLLISAGVLEAHAATTVLSTDFTTATAMPAGWTSGAWNNGSSPYYGFSADKGASPNTSNPWKQNYLRYELDSSISSSSGDVYSITFHTYASVKDQQTCFFLSSGDYSIVIGNSYNSNAQVYVGSLDSAISSFVSFQPRNPDNSNDHRTVITPFEGSSGTGTGTVNVGTSLDYSLTLSAGQLTMEVSDGTNNYSHTYAVSSDFSFDSVGFINDGSPGTTGIKDITITQVPEPATAALSLLGLAGLALRRRRA